VSVAGIAFAVWAFVDGVNVRTAGTRYGVLNLDFGYRRLPVTRSIQDDLCRIGGRTNVSFPECQQGTVSTVRPAVSFVGLEGDLAEVDEDEPLVAGGCRRLPRGAQFPATQVKLAAENRGQSSISISATGDASEPEAVRAGTYCGIVNVQRAGDNTPVRLFILASVGDRGQGALRVRVFSALLFGALAGAVVKWLGDRYAPVVVLRRRQRRLLRRMGKWLRFLPERAQYDFAVVDDGIRAYDAEGIDEPLVELEQQGDALTQFAQAMAEFDRLLEHQDDYCDQPLQPSVASVISAQTAKAARLRAEKFPWADPDRTAADATTLRNQAMGLLLALRTGDTDGYATAAHDVVGDTPTRENGPRTRTGGVAFEDIAALEREISTGALPRNLSQKLLDNALLITMIIGALVVALVGYQTEFVDDSSFDAGDGDYLRLFAWAFALQVAGVTLLEVAGKLALSRPNNTPPTATGKRPGT
jgi:hypothetical protein